MELDSTRSPSRRRCTPAARRPCDRVIARERASVRGCRPPNRDRPATPGCRNAATGGVGFSSAKLAPLAGVPVGETPMEGAMMAEQAPMTADLFQVIRTTRSMRRLKPTSVPPELTRKILEAGVCAPSGGNMQRWRFLVVQDAEIKRTVGAYYKRAWDEVVAPRYAEGGPAPGMTKDRFQRLLAAAEYLAAHIHEAPVWII